ncbi:MAG: hypothetical protein SPI34_05435 [Opitutales bacterium]|nr:hypothetical protein [Opitutales bacterium]
MTFGGWLTFLISTSCVVLFFVFCILKVMLADKYKKVHGMGNINTEKPKRSFFRRKTK